MEKKIEGITEKFNMKVAEFQKKINEIINTSYEKFTSKKKKIEIKEIEKWKNELLNNLNIEITTTLFWNEENNIGMGNDIDNNITEEIEEIRIENDLNGFTSKDIEEENKEITRYIQDEAYNYMTGEDKIENEHVAGFLKYVAKISRYSYDLGNELFNTIEKDYKEQKLEKKEKKEINLDNKDDLREFSSFVKRLENDNKMKNYYDYILKKFNLFSEKEIKENKNFFPKLFRDLTMMYFHSKISSPLVEINFEIEEDFNSEKMIDFINRGKNRKVNFIILPSLNANGRFLQNGKSWVFTYINDTFRFQKEQINQYLNTKEKF